MTLANLMGGHDEEGRKTIAALAVSIIVHLLIIIFLAFALSLSLPALQPLPEETDEQIEFTIIDPPPVPKKQQVQYIDTPEANRSEQAPEKPAFESDKNTRAASALPASGALDMPSQEGDNKPWVDLETKDYTAGPTPRPSAPASQPQQATQAQQAVQPAPMATPQPQPQAKPRETTQLALLEPPKPKTEPKPEAQKPVQSQTQQTPQKPQVAQPARPAAPPGYQPQTRVTRVQGNISNRGRSSVDALDTPMGRYKKMIGDAVGSRWHFYMRERMSVAVQGTAEVTCIVQPDGKLSKVKLVRNSSNESFASICIAAIVEAEVPPIPENLLSTLPGGTFEYSFTFAFY